MKGHELTGYPGSAGEALGIAREREKCEERGKHWETQGSAGKAQEVF